MALDWVVYITIQSFWIAFILGTTTLFLIRSYLVNKSELSRNEALMTLFLPCSIGFFLFIKADSQLTRLYRKLIIVFFVFTILATTYILFNHFELDII
jgi:hypothetical protein